MTSLVVSYFYGGFFSMRHFYQLIEIFQDMAQQRKRIVLAACGCFSPITNLHLRLFELARDFLQRTRNIAVVGGILSPTHDAYGKKGLVAGEHRLSMCRLATQSSDWLSVSDWETKQAGWTQTVKVLHELQKQTAAKAEWEDVKVRFLCGADLLESFSVPGLWAEKDIEEIVGRFGIVVVSRIGYNPQRFIYKSPILLQHQHNIEIVTEWIANAVSSTKIRRSLFRGQSIKYMVPDLVADYIKQNPTLYPPNVLDQFDLSDEDLDNLTGKFQTDLIESLSKESHSSPLVVQVSPLPEHNGLVCNKISSIVLSWTTTGIYIYQVKINGNDFNAQPLEEMKILPSDVKTLDNLIDKLSNNLLEAIKIADTNSVVLKHDFAVSDDDKLTISCMNGWKFEGDGNIDISSLLKNSLQTKGIDMRVISSIDAGMTYGLHNHSITVTLGSQSSNAYFQHTVDKAPYLKTRGDAKLFGIIANWGAFGEQHNSLIEYNADYDFVLDAESNNKGRKLFDKVVSDVYLNDIVWRVVINMIAEGTLFNGKLPLAMDKDTFVILINFIADNKCDADYEEIRELLDQLSLLHVTPEDVVTLAKVTSLVYQRAANFIAVGIAAILREIKEEDSTIIMTGSSRVCLWLESIQSKVRNLLPGYTVKLKYEENGALFGAALSQAI